MKNWQPVQGIWCICLAVVILSRAAVHRPQTTREMSIQAPTKQMGTKNGWMPLISKTINSSTAISDKNEELEVY